MGIFNKYRSVKKLDEKIRELTTELSLALDDEDYNNISDKLEKCIKLRAELNKPSADHSAIWAEVIKVLGCGALMAGAIAYDARGHVLPKTLDNMVPKIKP